MKWWPRRKRHNGDAQARAEQERKLAVAQSATPAIEYAADKLARLPAEELLDRMRRAFKAAGP